MVVRYGWKDGVTSFSLSSPPSSSLVLKPNLKIAKPVFTSYSYSSLVFKTKPSEQMANSQSLRKNQKTFDGLCFHIDILPVNKIVCSLLKTIQHIKGYKTPP